MNLLEKRQKFSEIMELEKLQVSSTSLVHTPLDHFCKQIWDQHNKLLDILENKFE